jgi:hypothetical protein
MAEYEALSYEEAREQLDEQLQPETDWSERDDLGARAAEDAAIASLETLDGADREDATRI